MCFRTNIVKKKMCDGKKKNSWILTIDILRFEKNLISIRSAEISIIIQSPENGQFQGEKN